MRMIKRLLSGLLAACVFAGGFTGMGVLAAGTDDRADGIVDIRDVVYINGEKYVCYDKYEQKNNNTHKTDTYGRFLKLSDEYYCVWQNGVDYQNGVTVKAFGQAPVYAGDKNMERYISIGNQTPYQNVEKSRVNSHTDPLADTSRPFDLSKDKAFLKYGTEDCDGNARAPRYYIDNLLFGDPRYLNGDYVWLSDMIRDTVKDKDDPDMTMKVFAGSIPHSGTERQTWRGYLGGASNTAVDNQGCFYYEARGSLPTANGITSGMFEKWIDNGYDGGKEFYYCYSFTTADGQINYGGYSHLRRYPYRNPNDPYTDEKDTTSYPIAKAAWDTYPRYPAGANKYTPYAIVNIQKVNLEWQRGKTAYSSLVDRVLDDYSWNYSDNMGLRYNANTKKWEDSDRTETMGTYACGKRTSVSDTPTIGGKAGTLGTAGKPVYYGKSLMKLTRNGFRDSEWYFYGTKEILDSTIEHIDLSNSNNNTKTTNTNRGRTTGWYVDPDPTCYKGTAGTVNNAKNQYFFPSIDLKLTNNSNTRVLSLGEVQTSEKPGGHMIEDADGREYPECDTVRYFENDNITGDMDIDLFGLSRINALSPELDNNSGDLHYVEGGLKPSDIMVKKHKVIRESPRFEKAYNVDADVKIYETEKIWDNGIQKYRYEAKGEASDEGRLKNITEDSVFLVKATDRISGEMCEKLIYMEPSAPVGLLLSGEILNENSDASKLMACTDVKLNDRAHGLTVSCIDAAGNEDHRALADEYMLLGRAEVTDTLKQLKKKYKGLMDDCNSSQEEIDRVAALISDYESISFAGAIDNENKTVRAQNVSARGAVMKIMVVMPEDTVAGESRARNEDIVYKGYSPYLADEKYMNYAILSFCVTPNVFYQNRNDNTDDEGFHSYRDEKTGITWHFIYDGAGCIDYLYTDSDIRPLISRNKTLVVPGEINGIKVSGIGGSGSSSDLHTFIPEGYLSESGELMRYDFSSVYIPPSVKRINDGAFFGIKTGKDVPVNSTEDYPGFTTIRIPANISYIGAFAFSGTNFSSVRIDNAAGLSVGTKAFSDMKELRELRIYGDLSEEQSFVIGEEAFNGDDKLTIISIPSEISLDGGEFTVNTATGGMTAICASYRGPVYAGEYPKNDRVSVYPVYAARAGEEKLSQDKYYLMYADDFYDLCENVYEYDRDEEGNCFIRDPGLLMNDISERTCDKKPLGEKCDDNEMISVVAFVVKSAEINGESIPLLDDAGRMETFSYLLTIPFEERSEKTVFMDEFEGDYEKVMRRLDETEEELEFTKASLKVMKEENERLLRENERLKAEAAKKDSDSTGASGRSDTSGPSSVSGNGVTSAVSSGSSSGGSSSSGGGGSLGAGGSSGGGSSLGAGGSSGGGGSSGAGGSSGGGGSSGAGQAAGRLISKAGNSESSSALYKNYTKLLKKNQKLTKKVRRLKKKNLLLKETVSRLKQQKTVLKNTIKAWKRP